MRDLKRYYCRVCLKPVTYSSSDSASVCREVSVNDSNIHTYPLLRLLHDQGWQKEGYCSWFIASVWEPDFVFTCWVICQTWLLTEARRSFYGQHTWPYLFHVVFYSAVDIPSYPTIFVESKTCNTFFFPSPPPPKQPFLPRSSKKNLQNLFACRGAFTSAKKLTLASAAGRPRRPRTCVVFYQDYIDGFVNSKAELHANKCSICRLSTCSKS